ncbi:aminoglycoside phosphotransferase family protein [Pseudomonas turukhanskensis]|uniref:Aminoglycoside phosphotransferase n=1 Tax=Pseudomonas turukhanskensis TaxID=1806536 RepID=A0A9W6K3C7_9PSED|nr:phosphotransferase [Pseudomonas turukhanskensis]GLK87254.1 aminoglycoside phosphotransferase [Pseudomonas turukhanskensis]
MAEQYARPEQRRAFLAGAGYADCRLEALPMDASRRCYFRLPQAGLLLMDSPPAYEPIVPFLTLALHLRELGLSAPHVLASDRTAGLALIEDFGQATYTRLLAMGYAEQPLYELAVDALVHLHKAPRALAVQVPAYDLEPLLAEAVLFIDWYAPLLVDKSTAETLRTPYLALCAQLAEAAASRREALVLRDFHVDNLMRLDGQDGVRACGLLDFQDALIGSHAYDLMSLLEDARRDVPDSLRDHLLTRYLAQRPDINAEQFSADYAVLAALRHAKIAGIFVRLAQRDGKQHYLAHLPRVIGQLDRALHTPTLLPLRAFLDRHLPGWAQPLPAQ